MKKFQRKAFQIFLTIFLLLFSYSANAGVLLNSKTDTAKTSNLFAIEAGFGGTTGETGIINILNLVITGFLGLLGVIFLIIMLTAGYKYMNARGDEKDTADALKSIRHAVVGLIITISAYAITYFVFSNLPGRAATGTSTTQTSQN